LHIQGLGLHSCSPNFFIISEVFLEKEYVSFSKQERKDSVPNKVWLTEKAKWEACIQKAQKIAIHFCCLV
jgi:hypothetical protein